jgi:hypothetical protein
LKSRACSDGNRPHHVARKSLAGVAHFPAKIRAFPVFSGFFGNRREPVAEQGV